ncbi:OmpA family protein [Flagellimonas algicola]|uniref:Flagellar motor protein MotB n=1 Tax=Flagellimonas algicola TaxID=2583815 RepID=A0ABY2WGW8_9FLAO|nr:OmpA family protein [Allomuricauda algicola]TMU50819.1 flagellar motor protein MotB [Allomuricauda algicola]
MKRYNLISILFIAFFGVVTMTAQSTVQKRADQLFYKFAYAKAIPEYEKMVTGKNSVHAYQRLAECYLMLRDFEKALPYFKRFINEPETPTNYYFKYAMALKSSGQEKEAVQWLKRYRKFHKNDARVKQFLKDGNLASVVFNSRERYEVEPVHFNTRYSEFGSFVHDGQLYFSSSRKEVASEDIYGWNNESWLDVFHVTEGSTMDVPRKFQGEINSKFHESSLVFSTDYKNDTIVYFTRNSYFQNKESFFTKKKEDKNIEKLNNLKIYKGEKVDGVWKVTRNLKTNADHYSTGHPTVNTDRTLLYFASDRPGGYGGTDIYYCKIHPRGGVGLPVNAGPIINTPGNEMFPYINNEGQLFFSSDGHVGFGQLDVFAAISDEDGNIKDVINLGKPLNSEKDDFGYYAMDNGVDGYVSSNRKGGKGSDDIYKFKFIPSLMLEGTVTDAINLQPLDSVAISLFDQNTGELVQKTMTNDQGKYEMFVNRGQNYLIEAVRKTHPHKHVYFSTQTVQRVTKTVVQNIELEPVMDVKVLAGLNKIYFDFNKSNIRPDAARELDKVVKLMSETYPEMVIKLESHTDPVGSHNYNDKLSERRAKSTYEYLIANGIPRHRIISYKGFGKRKLINDCNGLEDCNQDQLELNRRTEFPVVQLNNNYLAKSK